MKFLILSVLLSVGSVVNANTVPSPEEILIETRVTHTFWAPCETRPRDQVSVDWYVSQGYQLLAKIQLSEKDYVLPGWVYPASSCVYYFVKSNHLK